MNLGEVLRTAFAEIWGHKGRTLLTVIGIGLGTFAITVMTSFLDGVVGAVWDGFRDLGFDGVMYVVGREARDLRESSIYGRSKGLQPSDAVVLRSRGRAVSDVAPVQEDEEMLRRGGVERKARVTGVTPAYAVVRGRTTSDGRFLNEYDDRTYARVCVLGYRLKKRLFGSEDALGKDVMIAGRPFRVVGVGQKLGNQLFNEDEFAEEMEGVYVPLTTLRKFYAGEDDSVSYIAVKTKNVERLDDLKSETAASLKIAHRGAEDFRVQNIAEQILKSRKEIKEVLMNWKIVLGSIAGISLLVGGIGLLSVLLISIGERLYEIGLRKAIGATDMEIFMQFLSESVVLSLIGGILGAAAGVGVTLKAAQFFPTGLPIQLAGLAMAIGIAIVLGILYGIYPALKASRMEPVEALRSSA